jgi:hypothetical protein
VLLKISEFCSLLNQFLRMYFFPDNIPMCLQ